jgi:3-oxoacyl-[acyl-carrier protein] reductase
MNVMLSDFETIIVGESRTLTRHISEDDVQRFVVMTGDDNPLHVDRAFAEQTAFKDIVVHGMLGASFLSTLIGTQLPGPGALWVSQSFEFLAPVRLGDTLTVTATVTKKHPRERLLELATTISNQHGQGVLTGAGKVKVLEKAATIDKTPHPEGPHVALITGAGGGIGQAIARRLGDLGMNVVMTYNNRVDRVETLAKEINTGPGPARALAVKVNLGSESEIERLLAEIRRNFGKADVLINAASPPIGAKPLAETSWLDLLGHIDVQLKSSFLLTKALAPDMMNVGWGRIVNITSTVGEGQPSPGWTGYSVAKAGLAALTRQTALELGPHGITVNAIAPGMTQTPLIGAIPEKAQMIAARSTPTRRLASPTNIADAVAFLVSNGAGHITGQTLAVNGGAWMK